MIPKVELLEALVICDIEIEYVTVKELLKDPLLGEMRAKSLGVKLLRLRRQGLVEKKKFGKAYGYKLTQKGFERYDYFIEKRKMEEEFQELKIRLDEEYNQLLLLKALEDQRKKEKSDLIEILKLIMNKD